jgi:predicted DNA-binding transcriptional regulator YafY
MTPTVDGWWLLHTDLESPHEAQAAVLAQAGAAHVVAPPELITLVKEAAARITAAHLTPAEPRS